MTWHDHGSWKGPCSRERHAAIEKGLNPHGVGLDTEGRVVDGAAEDERTVRVEIVQ